MDKQIIEEMAKVISGSTELDTMKYYRALNKAKECYKIAIPEGAVVFIPTKERYALLSKEELAQIQSNFFDAGIKHGSKETAEKFAEKLKERFAYDIERCKVVDEILKEITGE